MDSNILDLPLPHLERHSPWVAEFVEAFFHGLRSREIAHCILRNYQDFPLPRSALSDIDVMVDGQRWPEVISTLRHVVAQQGLQVIMSYSSVSGTLLIIYIAGPEGPALHLDLLTRLVWWQWDLVDVRLLLQNVLIDAGPRRPRPGHEAAVMLLGYLFHRGVVKPEYRPRIARLVEEDRAAFIGMISAIWIPEEARALADLVTGRQWDEIVKWRARAVASLRRRWRLGFLKTLNRLALRVRNSCRRLVHRPGLWIAIIGPDGCGKSTVSAALAHSLASVFGYDKTHRLHWRPGILPPPKSIASRIGAPRAEWAVAASTAQPHAMSVHGVPASILRFLYFWIDFAVGANVLFRPWLWRNGLIIVERYYYDFHVDRRRYRLRIPGWLVCFMETFVPEPDLVFYLDAPEAVLLRRKNELSLPEAARQRAAFLGLVERKKRRSRVVDADRPAAEVVADLRQQVFEHLSARERRIGVLPDSGTGTSYLLPLILGSGGKSSIAGGNVYTMLPSRDRPRWVLPARNLRATSKGMDFYAPPTLLGKGSKWLIKCWLATMIGPRLLNRIVFDSATENETIRRIRAMVPGGSKAQFAISFGAAGPRQKLTLLIMDPDGRPLAYAKVADRPAAFIALRTDASFLAILENKRDLAGFAPRSLGLFTSDGHLVHVQTALSGNHSGRRLTAAHWRFLGSLADGRPLSLRQYLAALCPPDKFAHLDLSSLNGAQASLIVQSYAKAMNGRDEEVRTHLVHGDFVPWNMRICRSGDDKCQLCVYDWESGRERGLPLFDAFHFVIQTAVLTGKANAAQTLERLRKLLMEEESRQYLAAAGIADGTAERLLRMYLLEVILDGIETPGTAHSRLQSGRLGLLRQLEAG